MNLIQTACRSNAVKRVNELLSGMFEKAFLASHSMTGQPGQPGGIAKPALPSEVVAAIMGVYKTFLIKINN